MQPTYHTISALAALMLITSAAAVPAPAVAAAAAWPDPQDCHRFYECPVGGKPVLKTCGPGTAFQQATSVCDYEHLVASCWHH